MFRRLPGVFSLRRLFLIYSPFLILAVTLLSLSDVLQRADLYLLDQAFRWRGAREPRQEIAIVAISQQDFERGAPRWPWPRSLMARLIDQISAYQPAVIAIDILYSERSNSEAVITREQFAEIQPYLYQVLSGVPLRIQNREGTRVIGPELPAFDRIVMGADLATAQDMELADAVGRARSQGIDVVLAAQAISRGGMAGVVEPYPQLMASAEGSLGLVGVSPDPDGVLRTYLPYSRDKEGKFVYGLALTAVARLVGASLPAAPLPNGDAPIGDSLLVEVRDGRFLVNFPGPPGTHPAIIARDLLRGEEDLSHQLKDRLVFIGMTDPGAEDLFTTPFSAERRMPGVEFQAAAADTLLSGAIIHQAPRYQVLLALVTLTLGAITLGRFIRPLVGFAGVVVLSAGLFGVWMGLFAGVDYFLPIASPLAGVVAGYGFAIADRVSVEQLEKQYSRSMLSRYISPDVVEEMLKHRTLSLLGGQRVELTILFSDIRGFTSISERLTPEGVVELLNEYLTIMTEVIFRHEGTIDKFEGDAILVFFGAPRRHDDDADRAVITALEMQDRLGELEGKWLERTNAPLRIGVGINTGQALVGNIGSNRRMDYTIIGDTVNLAARIQELTKEYGASILISGSTASNLRGTHQLRPLGTISVRGRQQPTELYEVVGLGSDTSVDSLASLQHFHSE